MASAPGGESSIECDGTSHTEHDRMGFDSALGFEPRRGRSGGHSLLIHEDDVERVRSEANAVVQMLNDRSEAHLRATTHEQ